MVACGTRTDNQACRQSTIAVTAAGAVRVRAVAGLASAGAEGPRKTTVPHGGGGRLPLRIAGQRVIIIIDIFRLVLNRIWRLVTLVGPLFLARVPLSLCIRLLRRAS